jgi:carbonic anhydrase/acetyltransferase-like protein (isoleucine patch superfamily)
VTLGEESSVWYNAVVRGDMEPIVIGERSNIQDGCVVHVDEGLPCMVGRRVVVGHRVILHGCTVEDDCLIGMGSVVLNAATLGSGSLVAAGAVVPEGMEVPPGSVVMGIPGRIVRQVDDATARRMAEGWRHYVELARAHANGTFARARTAPGSGE